MALKNAIAGSSTAAGRVPITDSSPKVTSACGEPLQLLHGGMHRIQPFERMPDADGQFDERETEAVAELERRIRAGPQIDGHRGANRHARGTLALSVEIAAEGAGERGDQARR